MYSPRSTSRPKIEWPLYCRHSSHVSAMPVWCPVRCNTSLCVISYKKKQVLFYLYERQSSAYQLRFSNFRIYQMDGFLRAKLVERQKYMKTLRCQHSVRYFRWAIALHFFMWKRIQITMYCWYVAQDYHVIIFYCHAILVTLAYWIDSNSKEEVW